MKPTFSDAITKSLPQMQKNIEMSNALHAALDKHFAALGPMPPPTRLQILRARISGALAVLRGEARADYMDDD